MLAAGCAAVLDAHRGADSRGNGGCFEATTERRPILRFVNEPLLPRSLFLPLEIRVMADRHRCNRL